MRPPAARVLALRLLALWALLWPAAGAWELTILHTNDVHSRLEQTSEDSGKCVNASRCVGGVARLATKVRQIRRAEPHVLLLDAGDQYQGTIWFTVYKGAEVAHFMNALSYDAMGLITADYFITGREIALINRLSLAKSASRFLHKNKMFRNNKRPS